MKSQKTRIIVASGTRARFFESTSVGTGLVELKNLEIVTDAAATVGQKPGRSFSRIGDHRSALQPHHHSSDAFAKLLMNEIEDSFDKKEFDRLIIVAGPDFLGALRKEIPQAIKSVLIADIPKNLAGAANDKISSEIEKYLAI